MFKAHTYNEPQGSAVIAFAPSPRDRSFAAAGADGFIVLRHQTSERTLARMRGTSPARRPPSRRKPTRFLRSARAPSLGDSTEESASRRAGRALFGKSYQGYAQPEYVWQSTGATDDFEPKLSLVPLIFDAKGTFYALIYSHRGALRAVHVAVRAPSIKAQVKPAVESWRRCRAS